VFAGRKPKLIKVPYCGLKWPSGRAAIRGRRPNMKITRRMNEKTRRYSQIR